MASERARRDGVPGAVVLLSPACASYDQFKNFEERGDHFRQLVLDRRGLGSAAPPAGERPPS
jgi:UDP-N-acetylmuramoylalanine--D-glutamate ligase